MIKHFLIIKFRSIYIYYIIMPITKVFGKLYKLEKDGFYSIKDEKEISNKIKKYLIFLEKKWFINNLKWLDHSK